MTARDENRHSPTRRECAGALAQTSAQIQADRWERLLAEGPAAVAAAARAPWMIGSKVDLAQYYSGLMEKACKAGAA